MRSGRISATSPRPASRHVSAARWSGLVRTRANRQPLKHAPTTPACRRPSSVNGTSVRLVCRPAALHSVSPWRTRTIWWPASGTAHSTATGPAVLQSRQGLAEPGVEVARRIAQLPAGLVITGPIRHPVRRGDQLTEVRGEPHDASHQGRQRDGSPDERGRHGEPWWPAAGESCDLLDELAHGRELPSQDVGLADPVLVVDQEDPFGSIFHVHEVEAGVVEYLEPQPSRPDLIDEVRHIRGVTRTIHAARLGDQERSALLDQVLRDLVGTELGLVVVGEEAITPTVIGLVDHLAPRVPER